VFPVLFALGPLKIQGYGAMIALGGLVACGWLRANRKAAGLARDEDFWLLINALLISGFVGGRLLYLIEYETPFTPSFWRILASPSQGFSVLGAFAGIPLGVWLVARARKIPYLRLLDHVMWMAPVWHAFGRLGCLLAGCCHGRPTDASWGVVFRDPRAQVPDALLGVALHPTQLYEAAGDVLIAAILYPLLSRKRPGTVTAAYFGCYGLLRFMVEPYRGDSVPFAAGLTAAQFLGLALAAAGGVVAWRSRVSHAA
jgi:phosphatidylglycerol:prolipoprotein diacylglycerol transferase